MPDTTLEEARRCPKCGEPGAPGGFVPQRDKSKVYTFHCENNRCKWFETGGWLVHVNPDGSIHEATRHKKQFPAIPDRTEEVRAMIDRDIQRSMTRE